METKTKPGFTYRQGQFLAFTDLYRKLCRQGLPVDLCDGANDLTQF